MKISLASAELLAFVIAMRGYVVFRFHRKHSFRIGERFERFSNGTPLPQPFYIFAKTNRREWRQQCHLIEKRYGRVRDVGDRKTLTFFRCSTD